MSTKEWIASWYDMFQSGQWASPGRVAQGRAVRLEAMNVVTRANPASVKRSTKSVVVAPWADWYPISAPVATHAAKAIPIQR